MCGKKPPKWTGAGAIYELSHMSSEEWNKFSPSGNTFDRVYRDWTTIHDPLNMLSGLRPAADRTFGVSQRENERIKDRVAGKEYWAEQQTVAAPEKSAMEIYDAEGVRNRRRAAALMGINQLRTPSGPGTASGGSYSGVSGGLY